MSSYARANFAADTTRSANASHFMNNASACERLFCGALRVECKCFRKLRIRKKQNIESDCDILIRGSQGSINIELVSRADFFLSSQANRGRDRFETAENNMTSVDESEIAAAGGMTNDLNFYLWRYEHQQCFEPVRRLQPPNNDSNR